MSKRILTLLDKATELAKSSECNQKHAAFVIKGGRMLGIGVNKMRNNPALVGRVGSSVHAEIAAIRDCGNTDLRGGTLVVARVRPNGEQAMSKPCEDYQAALKAVGIRKVYYTVASSTDLC